MTETSYIDHSLYGKEKRLAGLHTRNMKHTHGLFRIFTAKMYTHAQRNVSEETVQNQMSCKGDTEWT
jgi:hypothetical protein